MIFYRKFFFCAEGAIQLVGYLPGIQETMGSIPSITYAKYDEYL